MQLKPAMIATATALSIFALVGAGVTFLVDKACEYNAEVLVDVTADVEQSKLMIGYLTDYKEAMTRIVNASEGLRSVESKDFDLSMHGVYEQMLAEAEADLKAETVAMYNARRLECQD